MYVRARKSISGAAVVMAALLAVPAVAGAAQVGYRSAVLGDGATAYYQFDETPSPPGNTATDAAGGDNNGTAVGGVTFAAPSAFPNLGTAFGFDGTGRVRIPDSATFDLGTGPVTVELWYNSNVDARGDLFTYKGAGGDFGLHANSEADPPASPAPSACSSTASPPAPPAPPTWPGTTSPSPATRREPSTCTWTASSAGPALRPTPSTSPTTC